MKANQSSPEQAFCDENARAQFSAGPVSQLFSLRPTIKSSLQARLPVYFAIPSNDVIVWR